MEIPADSTSQTSTTVKEATHRGVSLPVILLLGALIEIFVISWIVSSEVPNKVFISSWSIVLPGVFLLTIALLACKLLKAQIPRKEFLLVYIMLSASGILVGYAGFQLMFPSITAQFWFQGINPEFSRFANQVPPWLAPHSVDSVRGLFIGESSPSWQAWITPMLVWGGFIFMFTTAMICLATLLSHTWIRDERLAFPIVSLPLEMTAGDSSWLKGKLFWTGIIIAVILNSLLALNYYFPSVPAIQLKHVDRTTDLFPDRPWSVGTPWYIGYTPFVIGFAYLAPLDIIFSVFFFGLFGRLIRVYGSVMGLDLPSAGNYANRFPFAQQQTLGAFVMLAIVLLIRAVPRIKQRLRMPESGLERGALLGLVLSIIGLLGWYIAIGVSYPIAIVLIILTLLFATTLARVRAESGVAWAFGPYRGINDNLVTTIGSSNINTRSLIAMGMTHWHSQDMRFLPMPFHMESLKIADSAGIKKKTVFWFLIAATLIAIVAGFYFVLVQEYSLGVSTAKTFAGISAPARQAPRRVDDWLNNQTALDTVGMPYVILGGAIVTWLSYMRSRFLWWPFHPVGYVLGNTGTGVSFWTHYGIAWLVKFLILRYGGMKLYQQSLPFVFGIILGDLLSQTAWSIGASLLGFPVYQFVS